MFAIVRFTDEEDAPGIISTKWVDSGNNTCRFPNVRTEEQKNKLLLCHASPRKEWLICPMRMLRKFPNYKSARRHLREAEDTSNLESDFDCSRGRKRKRNTRYSSSSTEDEEQEASESLLQHEPYPRPPMQSRENINPSPQPPSPVQSRENKNLSPQPPPSSLTFSSVASCNSNLFSPTPASDFRSTPTAAASSLGFNNEVLNKVERLQRNQNNLFIQVEELLASSRRIESKLDSILKDQMQCQISHDQEEDEMSFLSKLPLGMEDFSLLDQKIVQGGKFKKRFLSFCMSVGGKDVKAVVANILRILMTDDVAEKFSLTGKSAGAVKSSFEKMEVYKLILEICFRNFKDVKQNIIREAISDWLMQAKFRKLKREKRARETIGTVEIYHPL